MSFIVIEGLDGAGKSTQVKKIKEFFATKGIETEYVHFPRYDSPIYGDMVAEFLRGDYGSLDTVHPKIVALLYALDRQQAAPMINGWLSEGKAVIVDRYVYSNIAYQCAKSDKKEELKQWILNLEYGQNKIPEPDLTLFLDVPFSFTTAKLTEEREGDDRDYLLGKKDIHEASLSFQESVREVYIECSGEKDNYKVIPCSDAEGGMATADVIFNRIKNEIEKFAL